MAGRNTAREEETEVRALTEALKRHGIVVRREKLARGHEFRVKSGSCRALGKNLLFVDKNLPTAQQLGLLVDYFVEKRIGLLPNELERVSTSRRSLLTVEQSPSQPLR